MKKFKLRAVLLAGAIFASLAVPATAAGESSTTLAEEGSTTTTLNGTIAASKLVVTVPQNITFSIDPTIEAETTTSQIVQPDVKITNGSIVPIYARISSVAVSQTAEGKDDVNLVNTTGALSGAKTMMFGLKSPAITDFTNSADWLVRGAQSGSYLLSADGKLAANDNKDDGADELLIMICGQAGAGWSAGDTFTLTPTIVVSAKPFTSPAV